MNSSKRSRPLTHPPSLPLSPSTVCDYTRCRSSVKRKFEVLREESPLSGPDVRIERHSRGSGAAFSDSVDIMDDNAKFEGSVLTERRPSGDVLVSRTRVEQVDRDRLFQNAGLNNWIRDSGLQSRDPSVDIGYFPDMAPTNQSTPVTLTGWQDLHENEGAYCMETQRSLRLRKMGGKKILDYRPSVSQKGSSRFIRCGNNDEIVVSRETLRDEREALRCLQVELEEERNASTTAANEAMAMIARLQEEKAAVLMEARQFKRIAEERESHNQEAITLLKEMLLERQEEIAFLENELAVCRQMFLKIEGEESGKEFDHVKFLEEGDVLALKEAKSSHLLESLKSWTSSYSDSRHGKLYTTNGFAGENSKEELTTEEFARKRKVFTDLHTDSVRNNLVKIFDQVGGVHEDSHACDAVGETLKCRNRSDGTLNSSAYAQKNVSKRTLEESEDGIYNIGERIGCEEVHLTEEICSDVLLEQRLKSSTKEAKSPHRFGKYNLSDKVGLEGSVREESTLSLWERIMKLEQRLDTFGRKEPCHYNGLDSDTIISTEGAFYEGKPCFTISKQETRPDRSIPIPEEGHFFHEKVLGVTDCSDKPINKHCKEVDTCITPSQESLGADLCCQERKYFYDAQGDADRQCDASFISLEQPGHQSASDIGEGVHDIYEVQHNQSCQKECLKPLVRNKDMPPQLSGKNMETSDKAYIDEARGNKGSGSTGDMKIRNRTPQGSLVTRDEIDSLSGEEVQRLTFRLQALETERTFMNEAIDSLKKENRELKLLQDIAQQLCDLKRTVHTSEQSKEQPSFISFLKGLLSFMPCGVHLQGSNLALPCLESMHCGALQRDHVGLCSLLEKSVHTRKTALVVRGLKVRIPIARQEADCS